VGEVAGREIAWLQPHDWPANLGTKMSAAPELAGNHAKGFHVLFADGSVRYLSRQIAPEVLRALCGKA
jgi:prepilin-type processing-associated H-X9-DG protein